MKINGTQGILILFLTHSNFYESTPLTTPSPQFNPRHPRTHTRMLPTPLTYPGYPRHPRYLADSNAERKRVFNPQLSCCKKHTLNQVCALTIKYCIELHGWRVLKKLWTFSPRSHRDSLKWENSFEKNNIRSLNIN